MKTVYDHIRENTLLSVIWYSACHGKRPSRSVIRRFDTAKAINEMYELGDIKLGLISRLVLGLVKVYLLKYKLLYEDFSGIFRKRRPKTREKPFKALPLKPITVELKEDRDPERVAPPDRKGSSKAEDEDDEIMEPSANSADNFEISYSNIEEARDSTLQNTTATQIEIRGDRRRRAILDTRIEYDQEFLDKKIRNIKNILRKEDAVRANLANILGIQPEIIRVLAEKRLGTGEESIEIARGQSMTETYYDSGNVDVHVSSMHSDFSEPIFNLYNLPGVFVFQYVVESFGLRERSNSFMALLTFVSDGQIRAVQKEPYGPIECTIQ